MVAKTVDRAVQMTTVQRWTGSFRQGQPPVHEWRRIMAQATTRLRHALPQPAGDATPEGSLS